MASPAPNVELVPALNQVDLPSAEPERIAGEISELIGDDADDVLRISAKSGLGVEDVLETIVERVDSSEGDLRRSGMSSSSTPSTSSTAAS